MAREITFSKHPNNPAEFERIRAASIEYWQKQGPAAIIAATWELSLLAYMFKGDDGRELIMDRSKFVKKTAPWLTKKDEKKI